MMKFIREWCETALAVAGLVLLWCFAAVFTALILLLCTPGGWIAMMLLYFLFMER